MNRTSSRSQDRPFQIRTSSKDIFHRALVATMAKPVEKMLRFGTLNQIWADACSADPDTPYEDRVLEAMHVRYEVAEGELSRVPQEGPVVVVANHPFGGVEGVVMMSILRSIRPNAKVMANYMLHAIPEMRELMIFVDPFGSEKSAKANLSPMKEAMSFLKQGGMMGVFPSGEVSSYDHKRRGVADPQWQPLIAKLIRKTGATVIPLFFEGSNSWLFQAAGMIHPRLRTLLLPGTMAKFREKTVKARIGHPIPWSRLEKLSSDEDVMSYLRMRTYILNPAEKKKRSASPIQETVEEVGQEPIIDPVAPELLRAELAALQPNRMMAASGDFEVWIASAKRIPNILQEIGRLREITFREVGEGTGKSLDIDKYDKYYLHLFVWNKKEAEIVGAYRLGRTDRIGRLKGPRGLYTHSLFKFTGALLREIDPAIELGRSFVQPKYQKQHSPLALLWKGVGAFVVANPQYKHLFGPVSISKDYRSVSQQIMVSFLKTHEYLPDMAKHVKPRNPPKWLIRDEIETGGRMASDINEVNALITDVEIEPKGVPVLLRQYLRLNAKFLCCNVDPEFSDVLDGLMLSDLSEADTRILSRHFGKEGAASFKRYHGKQP